MAMARGLPFDSYRFSGLQLLGRPRAGDGTCRYGYGPPVFAECGTDCVYCGRDLGSTYEAWLDVSVDHVIPRETVKRLDWPAEWVEDIANLVTSCRACNEFLNGYRVLDEAPVTLDEFLAHRDRHFIAKRDRVLETHGRERARYEQRRASSAATAVPQSASSTDGQLAS